MRAFLFRRPGKRRRSRGQSLAEFALVFPILMVILGGVIQFGIIFWGQNSLNQVVRDAGRYAVSQANCSSASKTDVGNQVVALTSAMGIATFVSDTITMPTNGETVGGTTDPVSDNNGTLTANFCPATTNADHVWIRITVNAQVPIFFPFVPGNGAISSTALFRMEPSNP
jgi:Flp pilus assembly protein TadG